MSKIRKRRRTRKQHIDATNLKNNISNYKSFTNSTKGFEKLHWGKSLFPDYRNLSGPNVSQRRINRAKVIVKCILEQESQKITKAFEIFAKKKFYKQTPKTKVDMKKAIDMVENTILSTDDDGLYGESDGEQIWISAIKMSNEALVGTILHESLHNICTINGKDICEKDEHAIMNSLGEQLDN